MSWNIIDDGERYIVQCTGDELAMTLPDEILNDVNLEKYIEDVYSDKSLFEFFVLKKDMTDFDIKDENN